MGSRKGQSYLGYTWNYLLKNENVTLFFTTLSRITLSPTLLQVVGIGLFFIITFVSGYRMNRIGKPYNTVIFNIHKLIGLAALVLLILTVYYNHQISALKTVEILICILAGLFYLVSIISGGLASIYETIPTAISILHKVSPYLTVLSVTIIFYLLLYT